MRACADRRSCRPPCAAAASRGSVRPDTPMIGMRPAGARQRADAPRRLDAVDAGQRDVHQHDVVLVAGDRLDRRLAAADEARRGGRVRAARRCARRGRRDCPRRRARAGPRRACRPTRAGARPAAALFITTVSRNVLPRPGLLVTIEIAAHRLGDALDEDQAQAGAAVAARHLLARLRERTEQPLEIGGGDADAAVGHDERQPDAPASRAARPTRRSRCGRAR